MCSKGSRCNGAAAMARTTCALIRASSMSPGSAAMRSRCCSFSSSISRSCDDVRSPLAARTAVGLTIPTYLWSQVGTESSVGQVGIGIYETGLYAVLIALTFVWPLMGAHGLLEKEKERLKDEVARRIETTIADLHSRVDAGEMQYRDALKDTLDGLVAEQGVIDKLRTWPWQTQTVSGLGVALLLPIII